jgi:hypothetical protein
MEDLPPKFQSLAATLAQLNSRGSVEEITVLAILALVIAGPLLASLLKCISAPARGLTIFCLKRAWQMIVDKGIETLIIVSLFALAGIEPLASAARHLLVLFGR